MKATDLLEKQHRKVEAIFKKLENGRAEPGRSSRSSPIRWPPT
jgi:hypothetical protein